MTDTLVNTDEAATLPARFPQRFGVHVLDGGVDVVVHAPNAASVRFCAFTDAGEEHISCSGAHGPDGTYPGSNRNGVRVPRRWRI